MRKSLWFLMLVVGFIAVGCSTGPRTPIATWNLSGPHMIYLEQNDRVPVAVNLAAWENTLKPNDVSGARAAIDPAIYAEMIRELAKLFPELAQTYSEERANELLISHRVLVKGYSGTNDLKQIRAIIETWGNNSEKWMPQGRDE